VSSYSLIIKPKISDQQRLISNIDTIKLLSNSWDKKMKLVEIYSLNIYIKLKKKLVYKVES